MRTTSHDNWRKNSLKGWEKNKSILRTLLPVIKILENVGLVKESCYKKILKYQDLVEKISEPQRLILVGQQLVLSDNQILPN